jgi:hypothetical protein
MNKTSYFCGSTKVEHAFSLFSSLTQWRALAKIQKLAYLAIAAP